MRVRISFGSKRLFHRNQKPDASNGQTKGARMKITELKVLDVERDDYIPKGQREGDMVASCQDSDNKGIKMYINVHLSAEDLLKHAKSSLIGKVIDVSFVTKSRLNIPFAGAPLKITGGQIVKIV